MGDQLREQQKLLAELAKKVNAKDPIEGVELERLERMQRNLKRVLMGLKDETEKMQRQLEGKPEPPIPPPVLKK